MKILHTSDWHIGKRLAGRERLDEQAAVLNEIASVCDREGVELVLVAGDVFDNYLPSARAESVFYAAVKEIAGKDRCVLAISGNHDDNVRLTAAGVLAEEQGIYIFGNGRRMPATGGDRAVCAVEAGTNHIVFRGRTGGRVYVNVLPYPNEARCGEELAPGESFADKMRRWIAEGQAANAEGLPSVFLSHLFVAGGKVSEGEREIDLGGARAVPLSLLPPCDYTALGHLHRRQHFRGNVYYSGSVLQYSFDEAGCEKSVVVFDLDESGVHGLHEVPLTAGRQLVRLSANGAEEGAALLGKYPGVYAELTLYLREPLVSAQVRALKEANEGLVSILPVVQGDGGESLAGVSRRQMSSSELFSAYYRSLYGEDAPKELTELFLSLTEAEDEA